MRGSLFNPDRLVEGTSAVTFIKAMVRWWLMSLYGVGLRGLENYRSTGEPVLIAANHTYLDALSLYAFIPYRLRFSVNPQTTPTGVLMKIYQPQLMADRSSGVLPARIYAAQCGSLSRRLLAERRLNHQEEGQQ